MEKKIDINGGEYEERYLRFIGRNKKGNKEEIKILKLKRIK